MAAATQSVGAEAKRGWCVALYLAGDSDLWQTAQHVSSRVLGAPRGPAVVTVLLDGPPGRGNATVFSERVGGVVKREDWGALDTGDARTLRRFAQRSLRVAGQRRRALILLGHGTPPEEGMDAWRSVPVAGGIGADWTSGGDALSPRELGQALAGERWDVVVLVCCYGLSLGEVSEIADSAGFIVGTPGEAAVNAGEVAQVVERLADAPGAEDAAAVAAQGLRGVKAGSKFRWVAGREIPALGLEVAAMGRAMRETALSSALAVGAIRPSLPSWGPKGSMVDVGALGTALGRALPTQAGRRAARALARGAYEALRGGPGEGDVGDGGKEGAKVAGLSMFLPSLQVEPWRGYAEEVPFARKVGWMSTLKALHEALKGGGIR